MNKLKFFMLAAIYMIAISGKNYILADDISNINNNTIIESSKNVEQTDFYVDSKIEKEVKSYHACFGIFKIL